MSNAAEKQELGYRTLEPGLALLIGISEYNQPWEPLPYVLGDIVADHGGLELTLRDKLGKRCFGASSIHSLVGEVTDRKVRTFLASNLLKNPDLDNHKLAFVYLSGHLAVDDDAGGVPCLVCSSTQRDNIFGTAVSFRWLIDDILKKCTASVLLAIDACYSGQLLEFEWPERVAVLLSSAHNEQSFANHKATRSRFTDLLIRGLSGEATNRDGIVTTDSLFSYFQRVAGEKHIQEPQFYLPKKPFILATHEPSIEAERDTPFDEKELIEWAKSFMRRCEADPLVISDEEYVYNAALEMIVPNTMLSAIPQNPQGSSGNGHQSVVALQRLLTWAKDEKSSFAFVLGDTGLGKSVLLKRFTYELCKKVADGTADRFPLLFNLRMYLDSRLDNPATLPDWSEEEESLRRFRAILTDWLQNEMGIHVLWRDFLKLIESGRLIVVLDGLDEMCRDSRRRVIATCLRLLSTLHTGDSKIVLSCRTHFFQSDAMMYQALSGTSLLTKQPALLRLCGFEEGDVRRIIGCRLNQKERDQWEDLRRNKEIGVDDLSRRPFLLDYLIKFIQRGESIRPSKLYDSLLYAWYSRDEWRFKQFMSDYREEIDRNLRSLYDYIYEGDDERQCPPDKPWHETVLERFLELLALRMLKREGVEAERIDANRIPDEIKDCFQLMPNVFINFFEYCIRTCSLMARSDTGQYGFIHKSIQAYFAARKIRDELRATGFKWDELSRNKGKPIAVTPWGLGHAPIAEDPYLLPFLLDMMSNIESQKMVQILQNPDLQHRIAANPNTLMYLYGNAITLLFCKHGIQKIPRVLDDKNISGAHLRRANLAGFSLRRCIANRVDLQEANLTGADLTGAQFNEANLHSAIVKDVKINGNSFIRLRAGQTINSISSVGDRFVEVYHQSLPGKSRKFVAPAIPHLTRMIRIEGGRFLMGSDHSRLSVPRERPVHEVIVGPFYLDVYPVTNTQFKRFVDANPEWGKDAVIDRMKMPYYLKHWEGDSVPSGKEWEPVVYVNWYAAEAYAVWASRRLPTEAEWEFALRDGRHEQRWLYPWGNTVDEVPAYFQLERPLSPIDTTGPRSAYGLVDMSGNVNEWVQDWFDSDWYEDCKAEAKTHHPMRSPVCRRPGNLKVLRGGSSLDDEAEYRHFTCHYRAFLNPLNTNQDGGFRCATNPDQYVESEESNLNPEP